MQKIPINTFLINNKGKYCCYCGKYTIRVNTTCPYCRANWPRRGGRCHNCEAAIDPEWSYCEICGLETPRAQRLKRAKMLSHRAKLQKVAHSQLPLSPSLYRKSPDLFGPDPDIEELDLIESTLTRVDSIKSNSLNSCDQPPEETPATAATKSTNVSDDSDDIIIDVVADAHDSS